MDCKEITRLKFYELIEKNHIQSQRAISKILNVSLGNVNALVKRLVESGCVEVQENPKNRNQYVITGKGGAEKVRLAYKYLDFSLSFCFDIRKKLQRVFKDLYKENDRSIVFYGSGDLAELAFTLLQQTQLQLLAVVDSNHAGQMFFGIPVMAPDKLSSLSFDKILITEIGDGETLEHIVDELEISRDDVVTVA